MPAAAGKTHAVGYRDGGEALGRLWFPPFAAGAMGTASGLGEWLCGLSKAHRDRGDGMHAVAKLMLERRIPIRQREVMPVLVDARGEVLWVPGVARSTSTETKVGTPSLRVRILT